MLVGGLIPDASAPITSSHTPPNNKTDRKNGQKVLCLETPSEKLYHVLSLKEYFRSTN